jgi:uncharacterized protein YggE
MLKFIGLSILCLSLQVVAADIQMITTTGLAEKYIEPNMVVISIETFGKSEQAKLAQDRQSNEYKRIKASVEKFKIKKEDFLTEGMSLTPEYKYDERTQSNRTIGYKVVHQSKIVIRQKSDVGAFLDSITSNSKIDNAGVVVNSISWDNDGRKSVSDSLVTEAVADARKKAELLAVAAGVKIKAVQSISYSESGLMESMPVFKGRAMSHADRSGGTELGAGTIKVRTEVSAQYRIE